ncbi:MAG: hypothetical protein AAGM84_05540 [Pseudomonadota bacterium]
MNGFLELLQVSNLLVGFLITLATAISGLLIWLHRRMQSIASNVHSEASTSRAEISQRIAELEGDMVSVRRSVDRVSGRVTGIEQVMQQVARKDDLAELRSDVSKLDGTFTASMQALGNQMDTLMRAALRASAEGGEQRSK